VSSAPLFLLAFPSRAEDNATVAPVRDRGCPRWPVLPSSQGGFREDDVLRVPRPGGGRRAGRPVAGRGACAAAAGSAAGVPGALEEPDPAAGQERFVPPLQVPGGERRPDHGGG